MFQMTSHCAVHILIWFHGFYFQPVYYRGIIGEEKGKSLVKKEQGESSHGVYRLKSYKQWAG